jgi:DNA polymerase (family 10)
MTARQVAHILSDIETLLQLQGENDFKSRAYGRAARALETSSIATVEESNRGEWSAVPGIGKSLAAEILEIVRSGTCQQLEALRAATPPGLLEILEVPRLGAKKVRALYMQLGITSLGELEYAARENRIVTLPGFGAKSQENILAGIEEVKRSRGKFRIDAGLREAERLVPLLGALPSARRAALAGRLRRGGEEFSSISFVVETDAPDALAQELSTVEGLDGIERHGRAIHALADERFAVVIHMAEPGNFFATLHHRTGAVDYEFMISIPLSDRGFDLRGDGLFRDGRRI